MPMMTVEPDGEKVPVKAGETILDLSLIHI